MAGVISEGSSVSNGCLYSFFSKFAHNFEGLTVRGVCSMHKGLLLLMKCWWMQLGSLELEEICQAILSHNIAHRCGYNPEKSSN